MPSLAVTLTDDIRKNISLNPILAPLIKTTKVDSGNVERKIRTTCTVWITAYIKETQGFARLETDGIVQNSTVTCNGRESVSPFELENCGHNSSTLNYTLQLRIRECHAGMKCDLKVTKHYSHCVDPENIHTPPPPHIPRMFFHLRPPTLPPGISVPEGL